MAQTAMNTANLKPSVGVLGLRILGGGHPNATDALMTDAAGIYRHLGWSKDISFKVTDMTEFSEDGQPSPGNIYYSTAGGNIEIAATLEEVAELNHDLRIILQGRNPLYYTSAVDFKMYTSLPPLRVSLKLVILPAVVGADATAIPLCECYQIPLCYITPANYERLMKPLPQNERNYVKFMAKGVPDDSKNFVLYGNNVLTASVIPSAGTHLFAATKPFADITF
jgi:hypothetical protein